jgi:hypothetical protein
MMVTNGSLTTNLEQQDSSTINTFNQPILTESSWIHRCKKRVNQIFKQGSKSIISMNQQGK